MEEGQRPYGPDGKSLVPSVLILVVMEEGQRRVTLSFLKKDGSTVLILVVMEEGQRLITLIFEVVRICVLILVVMEEGQRLPYMGRIWQLSSVLILVVMEEGQRLCSRSDSAISHAAS